MSEEEKRVVITFTARNMIKETADEIQINMRGIAWQVQTAAYSIGELNKVLFNNSQVGKEVTGMLHGLGAALRIYTIVENMAKAVGVLTGALKAQEAAEWTLTGAIAAKTSALVASIGAHVSHAASVAASTLASWAHTAALAAEAIGLAVVNALLGPWGWVILAGAAVAAATGMALASRIPSRQFGGPIREEGPYYLHAGEYVLPRTAAAGAGGLVLNVDARGSTFASHYDADKLANRILDVLKRAGVVER
jgi:hypothetical protein